MAGAEYSSLSSARRRSNDRRNPAADQHRSAAMAIAATCMIFLILSSADHRHHHAVAAAAAADLSASFYDQSCPQLPSIVLGIVAQAVAKETRMAASLLRLHFHDCFVNGCDASILLDDTDTVVGEKTAPPNNNSVRGFEVIDSIKSAVEAACPATVSCADILALAAKDSVALVGGIPWIVALGRRDTTTVDGSAPIKFLPSPFENLTAIIAKFAAVGLSLKDTVVLSGGHTIGDARCTSFSSRLYNFSGTGSPDPTLDASYLAQLQASCPSTDSSSSANNLNDLDLTTPDSFDNAYYTNLLKHQGLLQSDQELFSTPGASESIALVKSFSASNSAFLRAFAKSMINMGNISPLTGVNEGEIRLNCRKVNQ